MNSGGVAGVKRSGKDPVVHSRRLRQNHHPHRALRTSLVTVENLPAVTGNYLVSRWVEYTIENTMNGESVPQKFLKYGNHDN